MLGASNTLVGSSSQRQPTGPDQPYLFTPDRAVDIGEFKDVVRLTSDLLQVGLEGELPQEHSSSVDLIRAAGPINLEFGASVRDDLLTQHQGRLHCGYGKVRWTFPPAKSEGALHVSGGHIQLTAVGQFNLIQAGGTARHDAPERERQEIPLLATYLADAPRQLARSARAVLALRGFEEWAYPTVDSPGSEDSGRMMLADRAVALTDLLAGDARLRANISERLKVLAELGIDFETAALRRIKVWATATKTGAPETLFVNEGSGANQLPFILVPIALARHNESILIAEPEAHLHPKKQSAITSTLLRASQELGLAILY